MIDTVIYTAVTGDYDWPSKGGLAPPGIDRVYFTDGLSTRPGWIEQRLPDLPHLHPRRLAKLPKTYPHLFLRRYRYAVWIDGGMEITGPSMVKTLLVMLAGRTEDQIGLVVSPHFDGRDDAYGEATIRPPKYAEEPLDEQVAFYHEVGFPEHQGLYEGGVLAWDLHDPGAHEVAAAWTVQNLVFSYQDQVSLPFVLWSLDARPVVLDRTFRDKAWVLINAHRRED